jgi:hypothetical protein
VRPQPRAQDVAVGLVVVDNENARRIMHRQKKSGAG